MATAKSSNYTFRLDNDVRAEAEALFSDLGLSLSSALNIFIRQAIQTQGFPFAIKRNLPNKTALAAMEEAKRIANDPSVKGYRDVDSLMDALNS